MTTTRDRAPVPITRPVGGDDLADALTVREYATRMRVAQSTVRNQIKAHELRVLRPTRGKTYIPRAEYLRKCAELGIAPLD